MHRWGLQTARGADKAGDFRGVIQCMAARRNHLLIRDLSILVHTCTCTMEEHHTGSTKQRDFERVIPVEECGLLCYCFVQSVTRAVPNAPFSGCFEA